MKKIIYIDASSLKRSSCIRRWEWITVKGLTPKFGGWDRNYKAAYGTAFHKVYQRIQLGMPKEEAIQSGLEFYRNFEPFISESKFEYRTMIHLESTLRSYFKHYKNDHMTPQIGPDNKPLVEIKFQFPYYEDDNYIIYLVGTIDIIANYLGRICVTDHKVTGMSADSQKFFFEFELNPQSGMYVWMYYKLTGVILPFLINGIFIKKPTEKALFEGRFDGASFDRNTPIDFDLERLNLFEIWLNRKMQILISDLKENKIGDNYDLASCKEPFGNMCLFYNICRMQPSIQQMIIDTQCEIHEYNPLLFQE